MKTLTLLLLILLSGCASEPDSLNVAITDDIPDITIYDGNLNPDDYLTYSSEKIAWGVGPDTNDLKQPIDCIKAQELYSDAHFLLSDEKQIVLTFDNGYENGNTISILDTLKKHDVQAIFFITSQYAIENPELVQRMIEEGHQVGNHSWNHYSFSDITIEALIEEIMSLHEYMITHFQYNMTALRPPKGEFSERVLKVAKDLGYETWMWSYAYYDYDIHNQPDPAVAYSKLVSHLHPGEILLLHAVSDTNMLILDEFLDTALSQGYHFTISS